jgi:hypothetical protein
MNNKALGAWLKLVNPTRSYITADELHNFRIWAKIQIHKRQNGSTHQASLITEDALKEMFKDTYPIPDSLLQLKMHPKSSSNSFVTP